MHLIDIYIQEVTRRLPEKNQDIALELRSTIEDMLPENYTELDVKEILTKLGNPVTLASGYLDRPMHLIGPIYFDAYVTLLKMILPIMTVIVLVIVSIENILSFKGNEAIIDILLDIMGEGIWGVINAAIQTFFWITLVFAVLERTDISKESVSLNTGFKKWTPDDLKEIPVISKKRKISNVEIFGSIVMIAIFTVVYFNAVHLVGVYENVQGELQFVTPFFNQEVLQSYWFIVVLAIVVEMFLVFYKFMGGQWTKKVAILNLIRNIVSTIVCIIIFTNSHLINENFITYFEELFNITMDIKGPFMVGIILLFVVFAVIDVIQGFRKAYTKG
ncbi:hypothetical protein WAX74_05485 [Psychrobacillus sp. FJAT-51614]|uniref:ABC transporter permease n=1 Tax=Psychrobacillus mangrovi TaxID=3117745 RepID=A0ABU8F294_9BACI